MVNYRFGFNEQAYRPRRGTREGGRKFVRFADRPPTAGTHLAYRFVRVPSAESLLDAVAWQRYIAEDVRIRCARVTGQCLLGTTCMIQHNAAAHCAVQRRSRRARRRAQRTGC